MYVVCNYIHRKYEPERLYNMFKRGYVIRDQQAIYYMTFTVVGWIDIFSRQRYRDIVIESFKYCQQHKGLHLHAYVIMSNHVHLIVSVDEGHTISAFVRDCKKFTAKRILDDVESNNIISLNTMRQGTAETSDISCGTMIIILSNFFRLP